MGQPRTQRISLSLILGLRLRILVDEIGYCLPEVRGNSVAPM